MKSRPVVLLLAAAMLLGSATVVAGVMTARALRARDAAVREGIIVRASHEVERRLRENGPSAASETLRAFISANDDVSAVELRTGAETIAREGDPQGVSVDVPAFLGPGWRGMAFGGGAMRGAGHSPFQLRIWPSGALGDASAIAALAQWGSIVLALAVVSFAIAAARGIGARERAAASESERRRLEVTALAGAGLAHRIRNPLATIKATAQLLETDADGKARSRATRIVESSVRIERLIEELLRFAGPVEPILEAIDLAAIARDVDADAKAEEPVIVRADPEHVTSAVEELVANARAFAGNGRIEIAVAGHGATGTIEVRDRGPGLSISADRAFDPYVTTRADGTGLGLPNARALIRANGGEVTIANREGGGCVATITLPLARGAA